MEVLVSVSQDSSRVVWTGVGVQCRAVVVRGCECVEFMKGIGSQVKVISNNQARARKLVFKGSVKLYRRFWRLCNWVLGTDYLCAHVCV